MAKKKVLGITSNLRYQGKIQKMLEGRMDPETARDVARRANESRIAGFTIYNTMWQKVLVTLAKDGIVIPPYQRGLYRAFFNELLKASTKAGANKEYIIDKWSSEEGGALNVNILNAIADIVWPIRKPQETATKV
jgi:hypothetical protein